MAKTETGQRVEIGWFIPTTGDGHYIGIPPQREATRQYMVDVARAAEAAGYEFVLIPTGGDCLDAWVVGSWVAASTTKMKTLVAMRPGLMSPVIAARMAATLDRVSEGRALINVVTGHYPQDLVASGDSLNLSHDERYDRTREFLQIVKGVWEQSWQENPEGFDFSGKYYEVRGGQSRPALWQKPHPPLYFGGSSAAGKKVAAELADCYLMWAEPLEWIREQIAEMEGYLDKLASGGAPRRSLRYGLRAQLVVRETEEEAWKAAWNILSKADPKLIASREKLHSRTDATNQRRQMELWNDSRDRDYVIGPNLWAGLSAVRGGGAIAFVGTPEQVSDRLLEFVDAGITSFILSGYPHLEEAEISGRLLMPLLREKLEKRNKSASLS